jgi:putative DNA-invertase from lambdoid prophage Rac
MASRKLYARPESLQPGARLAYGYCRVSTEGQAESGLSIDEQKTKIAARCTENGWTLAGIFVDAGVSGSVPLGKRPEGAKLLAALRPGVVVVSARMDRCFRSAFDALETIKGFKTRKISLMLLDLGDVSGNGVSELIMTVLAAVAEFERTLISERTRDVKRNLRRNGRHQGGSRPFGYQLGEANGSGRARALIEDPAEQRAIDMMRRMRADGESLIAIRDAVRTQGFAISHETVRAVLTRGAGEAPALLLRSDAG